MLNKIKSYMEDNSMIKQGDKLVLGVSGGADSVCLFMLLLSLRKEYALSLYVVHVNHGIRENAAEDAAYVRLLCERYEVPFYLFEGNVKNMAEESGMSEEEAGRKFRYECFMQIADKVGAAKIATAHHIGDQAETVLFHLIRGTNLSGMSGIRLVGEMENVKILRPLLCVTKEEIVEYLLAQNISWKEDATNRESIYARNRLRNQILPKLCEINERAVEHIAEFATIAAQHQEFFEKAVRSYIKEHVRECVKIQTDQYQCVTDCRLLLSQEPVLAKAVIYELIAKVCGGKRDITKEHVQAVYGLLGSQSGRKISLPYKTEAKIEYENLIIRKCSKVAMESDWKPGMINSRIEQRIPLPNGQILATKMVAREDMTEEEWTNLQNKAVNSKNNYTKMFDCDTIKDTLYVRRPEKDDYFIMNEAGNHKKLSRYFIDRKIPEDERGRSIVVAMEHEVLWLVGERRCENHRIDDNTKQILVMYCEGVNDGEAY